MEQKDYLLRYIEQLGKVLAALFDFKRREEYSEGLDLINETYVEMLKLDSCDLNSIPEKEIIPRLTDKHLLNHEQLEVAAELLKEEGEIYKLKKEYPRAKHRLKRALLLYDYLEKNDKTFSQERIEKVEKIKRLIDEIKNTKE